MVIEVQFLANNSNHQAIPKMFQLYKFWVKDVNQLSVIPHKYYMTLRELKCLVITARKWGLAQGNVFTPVCHYVQRGGGVCIGGAKPLEAGGKHPTGMLSCFSWIEACINEKLPPSTELEEGLQNGVYLAKLAHFISADLVPLKKIYDRDQTRFEVISDNGQVTTFSPEY